MFEIFIGITLFIAIMGGLVILSLKLEKRVSTDDVQKKQLLEKERLERVRRIENNPAFQRMMDRCIKCFIDELLLCYKKRNRNEHFEIDVSHAWVRISSAYIPKHIVELELFYREYDMAILPNNDMIMAFGYAAKRYIGQKILSSLESFNINNCNCSITFQYEFEERKKDNNHFLPEMIIKIDCNFNYQLNDW